MPNLEDINAQQELLATHRRTLAHYLKQQALLGSAYIPPQVTHGIYEARQAIQRIKHILRRWHVAVDDLPDDEEYSLSSYSSSTKLRGAPVYRFRAECEHDIDLLRKLLGKQIRKIIKVNESPFPDNEVELYVDLSIEELRDVMRQIEDGHVMLQTVAPKEIYIGERNYDLF